MSFHISASPLIRITYTLGDGCTYFVLACGGNFQIIVVIMCLKFVPLLIDKVKTH